MKNVIRVFYMLSVIFLWGSFVRAETQVKTYFENTDHELTVYTITGKEPGKTMMIIGGIQGDEPGGYLAADLYADLALRKGNLIVIPRANEYSIKLNNRGANGDMNRKFSKDSAKPEDDSDAGIVEILKTHMSKADVLLNLHEGSGFFRPEYITEDMNPKRFGQSIIVDTLEYTRKDGTKIDMKSPALKVIEDINTNIEDTLHVFNLNNHDTFSEKSIHKEQRKSATYNALTIFEIPAFGIETSKTISSINTKVRYETLAINAFMKEYGIIPENPSIFLPTPELDHLVVMVGENTMPLAVKNGAVLTVQKGQKISVISIVANYKRGISVDIIGYGNTNDIGKTAVIEKPTTIKVYKDSYICGDINVEIEDSNPRITGPKIHLAQPVTLKNIEIEIRSDKNVVVSAGDTLHIVRGDIIRIIDAQTTVREDTDFRVNFYGYVGNQQFNDAEDRGYEINTVTDLMERFSIDGKGNLYRIETQKKDRSLGFVYIAIKEPEVKYVIFERRDGTKQAVVPGTVVDCSAGDSLKVLSIVSNVTTEPQIDTFVLKDKEKPKEIDLPVVIYKPENITLNFKRKTIDLGTVFFRTAG